MPYEIKTDDGRTFVINATSMHTDGRAAVFTRGEGLDQLRVGMIPLDNLHSAVEVEDGVRTIERG